MKYIKIKKCRCCKSTNIKDFIDFGFMSLTTEFPKKREKRKEIPMNLVICDKCKLFQLSHNYDLKKLYNKDYGYKSGINNSMKNHLKGITKEIESICKLYPKDFVLDIASNDGTLLKSYIRKDVKKIGIDPVISKYKNYYKNIKSYSGLFNKRRFLSLSKNKKAKIITSIAVFYDIQNPEQFISDIKDILHEDGIWVMEQSYFPFLIKNNAFDSICHEHLSYFMYEQIKILLNRNGLKLIDVKFNDMNGGSFRLFITHVKTLYNENKKNISLLSKYEKKILFELKKTKFEFKKNIKLLKKNLIKLLIKLKNQNKKVHIYGASTKGNVILQYCNIGPDLIPYAAERNPDKYGRYTPGSLIPIVSEKFSRNLEPDYYFVMPWHFKTEIIKREKKFLKRGGKFIFPLPKINIYKMQK
ncbi:MAG: methyltransferase domain-containing protein [Pelagibacteraceae bacterium TMED124]|nr:methyltransferase [Candidatus Neomarinimicrobiota bacterium]RPG17209.1 MAG: methyltransferase domain-containing protein [Pelagibacteraceae bacterium TMED124]|tara:strand:+ start:2616 stop:3857 length:1242 start_codon:yes stop_codon:yes gene_type:complete